MLLRIWCHLSLATIPPALNKLFMGGAMWEAGAELAKIAFKENEYRFLFSLFAGYAGTIIHIFMNVYGFSAACCVLGANTINCYSDNHSPFTGTPNCKHW